MMSLGKNCIRAQLKQLKDDETASNLLSETTYLGIEGVSVVTNRQSCKCGSTDHLRTSILRCPLNPKKQSSSSTCNITLPRKICKCGSDTHSRTSHRDCPLNKSKQK